jgi:gluconokinase
MSSTLKAMTVIVVMGVAGCGKSAVARKLAAVRGLPWIEGDEFHPVANVHKMREGIPLDDADRAGWLQTLCDEIYKYPQGCVLACSALKRSYRDTLRKAAADVRFVYLQITPQEALRRVAERSGHFYPPSLVLSQFDTLQDPTGESGVLRVDAMGPMGTMVDVVQQGLLALPS